MEAIVNQKLRERFQKCPINKRDAINLSCLISERQAERDTIYAFVTADDFDWDDLPTVEDWETILRAADKSSVEAMNHRMVVRCAKGLRLEEARLLAIMHTLDLAKEATLVAFIYSPTFAETVGPVLLDAVLTLKSKPE